MPSNEVVGDFLAFLQPSSSALELELEGVAIDAGFAQRVWLFSVTCSLTEKALQLDGWNV